jgi:hypothetical protein
MSSSSTDVYGLRPPASERLPTDLRSSGIPSILYRNVIYCNGTFYVDAADQPIPVVPMHNRIQGALADQLKMNVMWAPKHIRDLPFSKEEIEALPSMDTGAFMLLRPNEKNTV